jgi:hypothetical protein
MSGGPDATASDGNTGGAGSEPPRTAGEGEGAGLLGQVGHGFVYYIILSFSVGPAARSVLDRADLTLPFWVGALLVVGVAAVLTNRPDPPSYRRVTVFSLASVGIWWLLDATVGPTASTRGSLYPLVDVALTWLGAFLFGYVLAFGVDWGAVAERLLFRERRR